MSGTVAVCLWLGGFVVFAVLVWWLSGRDRATTPPPGREDRLRRDAEQSGLIPTYGQENDQ